jgi:glutaredoxin-related protein
LISPFLFIITQEFSKWPTYPQLYANGKLIGGLDIVKEMHEEGELKSQLPKEAFKKDLNERIKELLSTSKIMLFMKGTPQAPQCGFSSKIVDILNKNGVKFNSFNILADEEIRQGLKVISFYNFAFTLSHRLILIGQRILNCITMEN